MAKRGLVKCSIVKFVNRESYKWYINEYKLWIVWRFSFVNKGTVRRRKFYTLNENFTLPTLLNPPLRRENYPQILGKGVVRYLLWKIDHV